MRRPEPSASPDEEIVASGARPVKFLRFQIALWTLMFLLWGTQAVTQRERLQIVMAILAGIALAAHVSMALSSPRVALILHGERLVLRRRFRPLSIARSEVVAVRGDVPNRPTWSQQVSIQTRTGGVSLPTLDRPAAEIIARLQEWAGVAETPPAE